MTRKGFASIPIIIIGLLTIAGLGIGAYFYSHQNAVPLPLTNPTPTSSVAAAPSSTPPQPVATTSVAQDATTTVKIQPQPPPEYLKPATINTTGTAEILAVDKVDWSPLTIFSATMTVPLYLNSDESDSYHLQTVGLIKDGQYKNDDLLLVTFVNGGTCKGRGCRKPLYFRFIKSGNDLIFLPRISRLDITSTSSLSQSYIDSINLGTAIKNPFAKAGFTLSVNRHFTIPSLEYPKSISGPNQNQTIQLIDEASGDFDYKLLTKVFNDKTMGDIFMTDPSLSDAKSFYWIDAGPVVTANCGYNSSCFLTNGFYIARKDKTYLIYSSAPNFSPKDIAWLDNITSAASYDYQTHSGCSDNVGNYESVMPPSLINDGGDLTIAGHTKAGDPIYTLKSNDHSLLTNFYADYKNNYAQWRGHSDLFYERGHPASPLSYQEFLENRPLFFWQDSFGRFIRFENSYFLPPLTCEPIIYLYPQNSERVSVTVEPRGGITMSVPEYKDGWDVIANPDGTIYDTSSQQAYPYLFWEGLLPIFSQEKIGFVVKRQDVPIFFVSTLSKLGLNKKEAADFVMAWAPKLNSSPYYFVAFYTGSFVDYLAPLRVTPQPDTFIRILMDYKPLDYPIAVQPPDITTPQRKGFTVVEWGGLER